MEGLNPMQDWKRLATYVVSRRAELGYSSQGAFAEKVGVSKRTINGFERGESRLRPANLALLEAALEWRPGSTEAVLAGGEPTATAQPVPQPVEGADVTPEEVDDVLDKIALMHRQFGPRAVRMLIDGALARPVARDEHQESPPGNNSAAS